MFRHLNPELAGWGNTEELLAVAVELLDLNNRIFIKANTKEGTQIPDPIEVRRPWQQPEEPETRLSTPAEIAAFFNLAYTPEED